MPESRSRRIHQTGLVLLFAAGTALAHHSDAMFDKTKQITVHGTVKDWEWTSPHVWLQVVDPAGKETGFEAVSPNTMVRGGWRWNSLQDGDIITVTANPRRDGQSGGFLIQVIKADGTKLGGRPPGAPKPS